MSEIYSTIGRMMRAGDELSKTNKKLEAAAKSFVVWLAGRIGFNQLPGKEIGWELQRLDGKEARLHFQMWAGGWFAVSTASDRNQLNDVRKLCEAIAGPEGQALLAWMEAEESIRLKTLADFQDGLKKFGV